MDDLRPHDENEDVQQDSADESLDAVIDRLSAYTHEAAEVEAGADEPETAPDLEPAVLELAEEPRRFGRLRNREPRAAKPSKQPKERKDKRSRKLVA